MVRAKWLRLDAQNHVNYSGKNHPVFISERMEECLKGSFSLSSDVGNYSSTDLRHGTMQLKVVLGSMFCRGLQVANNWTQLLAADDNSEVRETAPTLALFWYFDRRNLHLRSRLRIEVL
jgi:hypothetical protein